MGWNADLVEVGGFDSGKVSVYLGAGLFELFTGVSDNQLVHHGHQGWVEVCLTDQRIHQTTQINLATRKYRSLVKAIFCLQPIKTRILHHIRDILLGDELCKHSHTRVFLLDNIVYEDGLRIPQMLFIIKVPRLFLLLISCVTCPALLDFHVVRGCQNDYLFCFFQVDLIEGFFVERGSFHKVNLGEAAQLDPLLGANVFVVEDDNR